MLPEGQGTGLPTDQSEVKRPGVDVSKTLGGCSPKYRGSRFSPRTEEQNAAVRLSTDKFGRDMFYLKLPNRKTWYP